MPLNVSVQHGNASLPQMPGEKEGSSWGAHLRLWPHELLRT